MLSFSWVSFLMSRTMQTVFPVFAFAVRKQDRNITNFVFLKINQKYQTKQMDKKEPMFQAALSKFPLWNELSTRWVIQKMIAPVGTNAIFCVRMMICWALLWTRGEAWLFLPKHLLCKHSVFHPCCAVSSVSHTSSQFCLHILIKMCYNMRSWDLKKTLMKLTSVM